VGVVPGLGHGRDVIRLEIVFTSWVAPRSPPAMDHGEITIDAALARDMANQ
jgi:hypothetical protein